MKTLKDLSNMFDTWVRNTDENVIKAEEITAQQVYEDIIDFAPYRTGEYANSIQKEETINSGIISTFIGSDLMVGPAKSTGKSYNLGYLLENGTLEHAIPNAFDWGRIYGYDSPQYMRTLQKDWHPGNISIPHYSLALEKNKEFFKDNIKMVWRQK